jgi:hypothetical protein
MKSVVEWDEQYIISLPSGEHDWLEVKGARALDLKVSGVDENKALDELSKQLSAFLNSGGGALVYGIADAPPNGLRQIDNGGVSLSIKGRSTKEWLEDVIPNLVDLPLVGFNVYAITKGGANSNIAEDKAIYIVEIPNSENAPHQARDKKYYARIGGKSRPINHRMVLDILGRARHPKFSVTAKYIEEVRFEGRLVELNLKVLFRNIGKIYAQYVNGFVFLSDSMVAEEFEESSRFELGGTETIKGKIYRTVLISNIYKDLIDFKPGMPSIGGFAGTRHTYRHITRYNPVLPGLGFSDWVPLKIERSQIPAFENEVLIWRLHADNMPPEEGEISLKGLEIETITIPDN